MHPEVNSDSEPVYSEAHSLVYLNAVAFNLAMLAMGVPDNDSARGRVIGIAGRWVRAALDGNPVGGKFIGNTINAFRRHRVRLERVGLKIEMDTFFSVPEVAGVPDGR